ncbi:zf-HC2 domain-containing protein [Anaerorhabdus sp.]|uniref:DUF4825 domain-containing protein n=1 Tax=Anaerorhabdus sp. TaxID=1872524 RepID=UPI002B2196CC|nr:zf-HC2 domain-containing protein [Anaerorhabdus sp.]MEA4874943.1 DUF4825 domain-containing protein [Anaerorhabdus sp.]
MKLPCSIIREILPNYVDNCCEEEASILVKEHLDECDECRQIYTEMIRPIKHAKDTNIDYLKRVKQKNRRKILISISIVILLFVSFLLLKSYVFGVNSNDVSIKGNIVVDNGVIQYTVKPNQPGVIIKNYHIENTNLNYKKITYTLVKSFSSEYLESTIVIPLSSIDDLVKIDNVIIESKTGQMYTEPFISLIDNRIKYVGDNVGVHNLLEIVGINNLSYDGNPLMMIDQSGYTIQLKTSSEPYAIKVIYNNEVKQEAIPDLKIKAELVLSAIDNCNTMIFEDSTGEILQVNFKDKFDSYFEIQDYYLKQSIN